MKLNEIIMKLNYNETIMKLNETKWNYNETKLWTIYTRSILQTSAVLLMPFATTSDIDTVLKNPFHNLLP